MWPYPRILAHRGGGTLAPENTYAGLRCGMQAGYRAIEFDVMLARGAFCATWSKSSAALPLLATAPPMYCCNKFPKSKAMSSPA